MRLVSKGTELLAMVIDHCGVTLVGIGDSVLERLRGVEVAEDSRVD
jgi:hypothetical protein